jgi:phosphoglucosamine mutase
MSEQKRFFGTDGIRGTSNKGIMTVETATKLGQAAGSIFTRGTHRHRVIIGKDTRLSGYMFETALTAGFISVGMDVFLVGPMPTPAIAMLARTMRADFGVMISASHNPYHDNGIKLFGPDGHKFSDDEEIRIEKRMLEKDMHKYLADSDHLGRAIRIDDAPGRYMEFVKSTFSKGKTLDGIKIVIDCANGASYHIGSKIFWELGAEVIELSTEPDGFNINEDCGSNHPEKLIKAVIKNNASLGIALDGDADRVVLVDENGAIIDGDKILAIIATYFKNNKMLNHNTVVATIMSNYALEKYLNSIDIKLIRTKVGDRYVASNMRDNKYNLGGEQSGHIIIGGYATTGDGLVTALQILSIMTETGKLLSELSNLYDSIPQITKNIKYENGPEIDFKLNQLITLIEQKLKNQGRIVARKSGTEPVIRITVEHHDQELIKEILDNIEGKI